MCGNLLPTAQIVKSDGGRSSGKRTVGGREAELPTVHLLVGMTEDTKH